jgi:hypothetical protein
LQRFGNTANNALKGVVSMLRSYVFDLPVNRDVMFADHRGNYKKKIEKQQRELIVKIPFIKPFLEPDESILLVTTGYSLVNTLEQILTAWIFIYLKRSLFIFTNKRIFHVPTTVRYGYRNSIAQILYSESQSIGLKGRTLVVMCGVCGHQDKFVGIRGKEKRKIKSLLESVEFKGRRHPSSERAHLCPRCTKELAKGRYVCPNCSLEFKKKSRLRSLLPGLGYFYVRQPFLGVVNIILELVLIGLLISSYLKLADNLERGSLYMLLFGGLFIFEKTAAMYHSNHFVEEYIPEKEGVKPLSSL